MFIILLFFFAKQHISIHLDSRLLYKYITFNSLYIFRVETSIDKPKAGHIMPNTEFATQLEGIKRPDLMITFVQDEVCILIYLPQKESSQINLYETNNIN